MAEKNDLFVESDEGEVQVYLDGDGGGIEIVTSTPSWPELVIDGRVIDLGKIWHRSPTARRRPGVKDV